MAQNKNLFYRKIKLLKKCQFQASKSFYCMYDSLVRDLQMPLGLTEYISDKMALISGYDFCCNTANTTFLGTAKEMKQYTDTSNPF